ncbi:MAG: dihydroorotate dehydrogenase B catalytic subunit [Desulfuromonadales bacterium GWD2_61_12]|nr:MAG: dihydroorotate dehydrogenase B catalytic subunit [Desulfuromonadales bacterium GWD2_61_12]HBT82251.1 dihydroorotate dehydrogenase [Desulfuromonas sp.]
MNSIRPSLAVEVAGLKLKNPVMPASGTFGYGEEYAPYLDLNRLGAIVTKGLSRNPKAGNPTPRIAETTSGMLNAIGLQNVGIDAFIAGKVPYYRGLQTPVIANFFGNTLEEYGEVARKLNDVPEVTAVELNISCPNVKQGGIVFGTEASAASQVVTLVRQALNKPLIVKLTPNVTDITVIARAVEEAGADAISCINTITGMAIDVRTRKPKIANRTGGLSGPAIRPVAVRMTYQVVQAVTIPVIGIGGITCAEDALEFLIVGAKAVQVGTANFIDPAAMLAIIDGLEAFLIAEGLTDINQVVGSLKI